MPELIRSIANRLREFVGNRRRAPRYRIRLEAELAPMAATPGSNAKSVVTNLKLVAHTRDISSTGIALVVPAIRVGGKYITGSNQTLQITLKLPTGPVELHGTPVRYSPFDEDTTDQGYLVGVQIVRMSVTHRANFNAYVSTLSNR